MLAAAADSAESSQLLRRLTSDSRQSCTLRIKGGGKKKLTESSSAIFQSFVLPTELPFSGPPVTSGWVFGGCKHLLGTWTRASTVRYHRMGGTELPRISGETHWKLPTSKPGPLHVILPH